VFLTGCRTPVLRRLLNWDRRKRFMPALNSDLSLVWSLAMPPLNTIAHRHSSLPWWKLPLHCRSWHWTHSWCGFVPLLLKTRDRGFGNSFSIFPLQGWPRFEMLALWLGSHF